MLKSVYDYKITLTILSPHKGQSLLHCKSMKYIDSLYEVKLISERNIRARVKAQVLCEPGHTQESRYIDILFDSFSRGSRMSITWPTEACAK